MTFSKIRTLTLSALALAALAATPAHAADGKWSLAIHGGAGVLERGT